MSGDFDLLSALAKDVTLRRFAAGKTPVCRTITQLGDTIVATPPAGKYVRLFWVSALNKGPGNPTISVKIGALECYRTLAVAHTEEFNGAVGDDLIVNLSESSQVEFTAHLVYLPP